jgi:predicted GH43/DUF377 family glycosyl hydrolase
VTVAALSWIKHGRVFGPSADHGWMKSHAQVPTLLDLGDRLRVYFATRPRNDLSLTTFVDLDRDDPSRVIALHEEPILERGRPGTFDADGVMPGAVIHDGERILMYYSGWSRLRGSAPYNNATGIAASTDGGTTFSRLFEGPILDRSPEEPWSATSPAVLRTPNGWHMWYSSGTDWIDVDGKLEHVYVLKAATSANGIHWVRENRQLLPLSHRDESQTRPTVLFAAGRWNMWFCYRGSRGFRESGETYRIGYAVSHDLHTWTRHDEQAGIDVSADGWDSQMICYPAAIDLGERTLLFYNGNGFGAQGFGYASLATESRSTVAR